MRFHPLKFLVFLALAILTSSINLFASPAPQDLKRSRSDANINAIGHRHINHGTDLYSVEKERELGKTLSESLKRSTKSVDDPFVMEYLARVSQSVAKNSDAQFPITVTVIDSDTVGAFTLPGGYQYISRGLFLRLQGEAELASVLARGIAHTALRSATYEASNSEMMQLASIPLIAMPGSSGSAANGAALSNVTIKMKRADELNADYFGVQYLYKAGYDPQCFVAFVQRIWGSGATEIRYDIATLPPVDERLAALQNEIAKIFPRRDHSVVSTPEFEKFQEQLRGQKTVDPTLVP
jgi:predicted Zn-dependent protease